MTRREFYALDDGTECERQANGPNEFICHRCESLWTATLGDDWRPSRCGEERDPIRGGVIS